MVTLRLVAAAALAALASFAAACAEGAGTGRMTTTTPSSTADLILTGGVVYTMDPARPRAEAIAIRGQRIAIVGSAEEVKRAAGPDAVVIDLAGRAATPGLVDGHCHLYGLGHAGETLSLRGVKSAEAAAARVADAARSRPEGEWIQGRGWDQNLWSPSEFPSHDALDAAAPKNPVALRRVDGHALWANKAAMALAGVTKQTPDPLGGRVLRRGDGEPTGLFIDRAMELVELKIPHDTPAIRERKILAAADEAVRAGLTGVHEMGIDDETIAVYRALAASGRLKLRVYALLAGEGQIGSLPSRKPDIDADGTSFFVLRAVKLFADGALGSRGAALLSPYKDEPGATGLLLMSAEELKEAAAIAAKSGFQLGVHAIGDKANRMVLDAFESAGAGSARLRFRVEHAQILAAEDIPRFAQLSVLASMQPTHATSDMPWAPARLGEARLSGAYAWRSLLNTGAHVVFGSDFPVEETSPMLGIYAAVTRQDKDGNPKEGFLPGQRLTLEEALRAFTVEPAYASFTEGQRGALAPGYVADVTVFDRDLRADKSLLEARADITIVGGKVVYQREGRVR